ncbi:methylaspartate mutase [Micromonospora sp. STR1_7]|uniref:Methylaspartate mutase n=1 Tax=Micromonospora parastrephiae TaxID=2806101 RepID=A0ABS1XR61_9ACTN|nr:methylaspartate mutase [Micromonospora parastrephiae]MBM0230755.1 methylaspartate mutase [Micromonospora parastrephiae]MBM0231733.1 methylaspartate mutase [Micromonospora parastrephiae]
MTAGAGNAFGAYVARVARAGQLVVQPRMGFGRPEAMRAGLLAVRAASVTSVGTLTVDSFTRVGLHDAARRALDEGRALNGYPIVTHAPATNRAVLDGAVGPEFPVQVRHGSSRPQAIISALTLAGLDTTEGGPVSYCLPYGRTGLRESVRNWRESCELLTRVRQRGAEPHLETFGGCMMGQLCPPSLLVALSLLEALFFCQHGLRSVSLSYAQQTDTGQDEQAVRALRVLAGELLAGVEWHVVVYTYMGVYPRSRGGALLLLEEAVTLAVRTGAARVIVKTVSEAHRLPTIAENVEALEVASLAARTVERAADDADNEVLVEARGLVERVLDLREDVGEALIEAFTRGFLDVPYCLHPDNRRRSGSCIDIDGRLRWTSVGAMPIPKPAVMGRPHSLTADGLLTSLTYVQRKFDGLALASG